MRRRQQFAVAHSLLEAQAAALKSWARRQKVEPVPAPTETIAPLPIIPHETSPAKQTEQQPEQTEQRRPGFCMRCGRHIGQGVWMHQKTCKG